MSEIRTLGPWLERFFLEHIITERNLAINTRDSYRDTFELLLPFVCRTLKKPDDRLLVRDITSSLVLQFLAHLEEDRGCSAQTRNQASDCYPRVCTLRGEPRSGSCRLVRSHPGHSVEKVDATANRISDEGGD